MTITSERASLFRLEKNPEIVKTYQIWRKISKI